LIHFYKRQKRTNKPLLLSSMKFVICCCLALCIFLNSGSASPSPARYNFNYNPAGGGRCRSCPDDDSDGGGSVSSSGGHPSRRLVSTAATACIECAVDACGVALLGWTIGFNVCSRILCIWSYILCWYLRRRIDR